MSEYWKNRIWQLVLVCTFAVVLSVCNKAMDSSKKSSSGIAYADFKPSDITAVMYCKNSSKSNGINSFYDCDSSDSTSLSGSSNSISVGSLVSSGFRPCGVAAVGSNSDNQGHFFFCK